MKAVRQIALLSLFLGAIYPVKLVADSAWNCSDEETDFIEAEIEKALCKPNKWGYEVVNFSRLSGDGHLFFHFGADIVWKNAFFTSVKEAQDVFVEIEQDFIRTMNEVRVIRPYLSRFPFVPANCQLDIKFQDSNGIALRSPHFFLLSLTADKLHFGKYGKTLEKPPQPALQKFSRSVLEIPGLKELFDPRCPRKAVDPKPALPSFPVNSGRYSDSFIQHEIGFLCELCKKTDLSLIVIGSVGKYSFERHCCVMPSSR